MRDTSHLAHSVRLCSEKKALECAFKHLSIKHILYDIRVDGVSHYVTILKRQVHSPMNGDTVSVAPRDKSYEA